MISNMFTLPFLLLAALFTYIVYLFTSSPTTILLSVMCGDHLLIALFS